VIRSHLPPAIAGSMHGLQRQQFRFEVAQLTVLAETVIGQSFDTAVFALDMRMQIEGNQVLGQVMHQAVAILA
jgi:hypothetical protein